MIDNQVIIWTIISLVICFVVPIGALIVLQVKKQRIAKAFLVGMLTFFVMQIVLRISLMNYVLPHMSWYVSLSANIIPFGIFTAFTAGLFEEGGRVIFMKLLLKKNHRYVDGIAFGFGHGGCESMILVGLSLVNTLAAFLQINNGTFLPLYTKLIGSSQAQAIYQQYLSVTALNAGMSGLERVLTIAIQIGLSMLILTGIRKKKTIQYFLLALLAHTAIDTSAVLLPRLTNISTLGVEGAVAVFSVLAILYTVLVKKSHSEPDSPPEEPAV